ncbi:MAG: glycerate kinase [Streptosporangiales bacterium]|nr:glycerate kinase [Streptosporangiales bacterium]MBO0891819.1 glycerate kinase [Acidothermales bacterium]
MHLLAAPDKFRGTATAPEVAAAMATAARETGWTCSELPLADGGEGTVGAFGGPNRETVVTGPLGRPATAGWRLDGGRAVVEMATASGLQLAGGAAHNDPVAATTRGTGELVAAALDAGAERVLVGIGGSATTDGGLGAVEVLTRYAPLDGRDGRPGVSVACDVTTLFLDAAAVFAPQKGADAARVALLRDRLEALANRYEDEFGVDVRNLPGSGGAGGLGGGLAALGARLVPGFRLIADAVGLADAVASADLVVTGEGKLDAQSLTGKVVGGVAELAGPGRTAAVVGGRDDVDVPFPVVSLIEAYGRERAFTDTLGCVRDATARLLAGRG